MIKFEHTEVVGWEAAIRGMRNPMNSWEKSDSHYCNEYSGCEKTRECDSLPGCYEIGTNDFDLMKRLRNAGTDHRKFMRMIVVYADITAPLYWWKEFDTYKIGTVSNSCSTMHKIHAKEFTRDDFSWDHLLGDDYVPDHDYMSSTYVLDLIIESLNFWRHEYLTGKKTGKKNDKRNWWQMIQLLPSSYNQKRTVMMNYEVLANIYKSRKNHKLDEWAEHNKSTCNVKDDARECQNTKEWLLCEECSVGKGFCDWIKTLPYSGLITGEIKEERKGVYDFSE